MGRIESLGTIIGTFQGRIETRKPPHRDVAFGKVTYKRPMDGSKIEVTISANNLGVRRMPKLPAHATGQDFRRYIRLERGTGQKKDTIIAIVEE